MKDQAISEQKSKQNNYQKLIKQKTDPFPAKIKRDMTLARAKQLVDKDKEISLIGRVVSLREHGKSIFIDLKDESGKLQVYFKFDVVGQDSFEQIKLLDIGDFIEVSGKMFQTKQGEDTLLVKSWRFATKSLLPYPSKWFGLKDVETRYRRRYLDFMLNPQVKNNITIRGKIISELRKYLEEYGFMEVETPILQSIPGGAAARPFKTHHNILAKDFYLRISPELYLKRMIVGGFEQVYEIGRDFRNEGLSHMHNPEFTMCEFYWAYKDYHDLMEFSERLISHLVQKVKKTNTAEYQGQKIDFGLPFARAKYVDLIKKECGIDILKAETFEKLNAEIKAKKIQLQGGITVWAKLVDELFKKVCRPKIIQPTFVMDYPTELVPLAKKLPENPRLTQTFQLVCAGGFELLKAYSELNDPIEQEKRMRDQMEMRKEGYEEGENLDLDFVEALSYGMPPTAGWGMGIDRLAMILTDNHSIKEVIAFPTLKPFKKKD